MIGIVDYGSGNIQAIRNIYKKLRIDCEFVSEPGQLQSVTKLVLPGVGAFDDAMTRLNESGMRDALDLMVLDKKVPVLGICVGMQIMASGSDEGKLKGLGWFDAQVNLFDERVIKQKPKLPHMGWNEVQEKRKCKIFDAIDLAKGFYFLHSFYFKCGNAQDVLAEANYGGNFHCAIHKENIYGVQFHPEKSHSNGVNLFKNFSELC